MRGVEGAAAKFGIDSLSKGQVSRLCAAIDEEVDPSFSRDWPAVRFACLLLDATYVRRRVGGRVRGESSIAAIGVGDGGRRHLLGFTCANAEGYAS